jgi:ParB/RepB/Spo0J family partition protein
MPRKSSKSAPIATLEPFAVKPDLELFQSGDSDGCGYRMHWRGEYAGSIADLTKVVNAPLFRHVFNSVKTEGENLWSVVGNAVERLLEPQKLERVTVAFTDKAGTTQTGVMTVEGVTLGNAVHRYSGELVEDRAPASIRITESALETYHVLRVDEELGKIIRVGGAYRCVPANGEKMAQKHASVANAARSMLEGLGIVRPDEDVEVTLWGGNTTVLHKTQDAILPNGSIASELQVEVVKPAVGDKAGPHLPERRMLQPAKAFRVTNSGGHNAYELFFNTSSHSSAWIRADAGGYSYQLPSKGAVSSEAFPDLRSAVRAALEELVAINADETVNIRWTDGEWNTLEPGITRRELVQTEPLPAADDLGKPENLEAVLGTMPTFDLAAPVVIEEPDTRPEPSQPSSAVQTIPFYKLKPSPLNPRKSFDAVKLEELAASILEKGVLQNLVARPVDGDTFEIAAGERRWRAVSLLVQQERVTSDYPMPVRVQALDDRELLELAISENVQRSDMHPMEEAEAFAAALQLGADLESLALKVGKSLQTVKQRVGLAQRLAPEAKALLLEDKITLAAAQAFTGGSFERQAAFIKKAAKSPYMLHEGTIRAEMSNKHIRVNVAVFPLEWYKGEIVEDLFEPDNSYFLDTEQVRELQAQGVERLEEQLKGEFKWVEVVREDYFYPEYRAINGLTHRAAKDDDTLPKGAIIHFKPGSLEVKVYRDYVAVKPQKAQDAAPKVALFTVEELQRALDAEHPGLSCIVSEKLCAALKGVKLESAIHNLTERVRDFRLEQALMGGDLTARTYFLGAEARMTLVENGATLWLETKDEPQFERVQQFSHTDPEDEIVRVFQPGVDLARLQTALARALELATQPPQWLEDIIAPDDEGDDDGNLERPDDDADDEELNDTDLEPEQPVQAGTPDDALDWDDDEEGA